MVAFATDLLLSYLLLLIFFGKFLVKPCSVPVFKVERMSVASGVLRTLRVLKLQGCQLPDSTAEAERSSIHVLIMNNHSKWTL